MKAVNVGQENEQDSAKEIMKGGDYVRTGMQGQAFAGDLSQRKASSRKIYVRWKRLKLLSHATMKLPAFRLFLLIPVF